MVALHSSLAACSIVRNAHLPAQLQPLLILHLFASARIATDHLFMRGTNTGKISRLPNASLPERQGSG